MVSFSVTTYIAFFISFFHVHRPHSERVNVILKYHEEGKKVNNLLRSEAFFYYAKQGLKRTLLRNLGNAPLFQGALQSLSTTWMTEANGKTKKQYCDFENQMKTSSSVYYFCFYLFLYLSEYIGYNMHSTAACCLFLWVAFMLATLLYLDVICLH